MPGASIASFSDRAYGEFPFAFGLGNEVIPGLLQTGSGRRRLELQQTKESTDSDREQRLY